jgi:hypothetical protein
MDAMLSWWVILAGLGVLVLLGVVVLIVVVAVVAKKK